MSNRNWLIAALALSVMVNLALGGFLLGRMTAVGPPPAVDPMLSSLRMVRALPEDRRDQLRPLVRESLHAMRPEVRQMWRAQRRIGEALTAEPFQAEDLAAGLGDFRTALVASQERSHAGMVRLAEAMTPDERRLLRDAMRSPRHRPHHRDLRPDRERPPR